MISLSRLNNFAWEMMSRNIDTAQIPLEIIECCFFFFFFKLYNIVLVLPNIEMNPPQVSMCSPSWTLLPPPSPYRPSGSSQCTNPKHPVSCIEPGLATHFIHDSIHVSMPFSQIFPPSPSPTESIRRMLPLLPKKYNPSLEFVSRISVIQILELCDL